MSIRTRIATTATTAALALSLALGVGTTAQAASQVNVLANQCTTSHTSTCIEKVKQGSHRITVRDQHGKAHTFKGKQAILAGLKRWSIACREEDSPRCYWDASEAGNGVGWSFMVIGQDKVVYLSKI